MESVAERLPVRGAAVRALDLPLPPARMPLLHAGRPLKRWRYVGVFGPELMVCAGVARIGPLAQRFWAVCEPRRPLVERTSLLGGGELQLPDGAVRVRSRDVRIDLALEPAEAVEVVSPSGRHGYVWTRKQAGAIARGSVELDGRELRLDAEAVVDETAGYHERHTAWRWSAGVGRSDAGERVGWNLVTGVADGPRDSERTLWVEGAPEEVGPVRFADDLGSLSFDDGGRLAIDEWAARENRTRLPLLRSYYRQPFGSFSGTLPGGRRLSEGWGVMEEHDVHW